jgi:hypothetical protein
VPATQIQHWLRANFARWGKPERLRVDNGAPWGSSQDLPTALALWLWGLDIGIIWNPPRRPQNNGKVERFNGLLDQWGEPARCADWREWGEHLAWVVRLQRERYPACEGQSRSAAYPELEQNPRAYTPAGEAAAWDVQRVDALLGQGTWRRVVNKTGQISLYGRCYQVGRAFRGQTVFVQFDPMAVHWRIEDRNGQELASRPARELAPEQIVRMEVGNVKPGRQKQRSARGLNPLAHRAV